MSQEFHRFRGASLNEAYHRMREKLGSDAIVLRTAQVREEGFLGFFGKKVIEVTAAAAPKSDYRDVTMPDHAPAQPGGANDAAAFAYCFGYIRAQLQVLKADYPEVVEL